MRISKTSSSCGVFRWIYFQRQWTIESLRNKKKQPNEDTIHATINKDLTSVIIISVIMVQLKERLAVFLDKKKLLNLTKERVLITRWK